MSERTEERVLPAATTRLVVLGDPHGDLLALDLALARERKPHVAILSAGDNVGYADGEASSHLCRALAAAGIASVRGNHEAWGESGTLKIGSPEGGGAKLDEDALAWCLALPDRIRVRFEASPEVTVSLVHSLPGWTYVDEDNAERLALDEGSLVTFVGHSHAPAIYILREGQRSAEVRPLDPRAKTPVEVALEPGARYVVDAGSLARPCSKGKRPRTHLDKATYAALDLGSRRLSLHALDKKAVLEKLFRQALEDNTRRAREG